MPRNYVNNIAGSDLKSCQLAIEKLILRYYVRGNPQFVAKKIIALFFTPENSLKMFKR